MGYREDYYKFTHFLLPHTIFKYGRLFIYRLLRDEQSFTANLKKIWSTVELEASQSRSDPPNFSFDIIYPNNEYTGIILTIPEAKENHEAAYIGITYDENDNFRYFTYEVGKGDQGETVYFLCEWTSDWKHLNYGLYTERDKSIFVKELSDLLIYDLLLEGIL